jgi:hypothetical protein
MMMGSTPIVGVPGELAVTSGDGGSQVTEVRGRGAKRAQCLSRSCAGFSRPLLLNADGERQIAIKRDWRSEAPVDIERLPGDVRGVVGK